MPRPTKLDKKLHSAIVKSLKTGAAVEDVCQHVGIGKSTFYQWLDIGEAALAGQPHERMPDDEDARKQFADFADAVTRALVDAKRVAIGTLRGAMTPYRQTTRTTKTFTETRLNKRGEPYEYRRVEKVEAVTVYPGDWKAAVEYLKRRHPAEWGDRLKVEEDAEAYLLDLIRLGEIDTDELRKEFGDDLATQWLAAAGVSVVAAPADRAGAGTESGEG